MIHFFGDSLTEKLFTGIFDREVLRFPQTVLKVARRKLDLIAFAGTIRDLGSPPANRLEKLKGDLAGFYSIRINDQWRIIFRWEEDGAYDVSIIDYH